MPKQRIEYAEGFIRDVQILPTIGRFTLEIDKIFNNNWYQGNPIHIVFNLVEGITGESVGKRYRIILEPVDTDP